MVIIKTFIHLRDEKGREKVIEHGGNRDFNGLYMERRVPDLTKPFGELVPDNHKYKQVKEYFEQIHDEYYFKHTYFQELDETRL